MLLSLFTLVVIFIARIAQANQVHLNTSGKSTTCSGVWKQGEIFGNSKSYIQIDFNTESSHGKIAYIVYESQDFQYIGTYNNVTGKTEYICDESAIAKKYCKTSEIGTFIVHQGNNSIATSVIEINNSSSNIQPIHYDIKETGYYCVAMIASINIDGNSSIFDSNVEWHFPYGELPAEDYPKLLFYGFTFIVYTVIGILWGIQTYRYWADILPVQKYLSGSILYLIIEMCFNWIFWELYNKQGEPTYTLLTLVSLLNAGRNSVSFFMLLVVCMGYSIVRPTLGPAMKKCTILAIIYFVFGIIYSFGSVLLNPETSGIFILAIVLPLAITLTAFYVWIFYSIRRTLIYLETRKQYVKITMYNRLFWLLIFSIIAVLILFTLNGTLLIFFDLKTMQQYYWKYKWISLEGLLHVIYFIVFLGIILLWQPTSHNARYGLQQISQDEDEALDLEVRLQRYRRHAENGVLVENNSFEFDDILDEEDQEEEYTKVISHYANTNKEQSSL